jgi:hypothetical protein
LQDEKNLSSEYFTSIGGDVGMNDFGYARCTGGSGFSTAKWKTYSLSLPGREKDSAGFMMLK